MSVSSAGAYERSSRLDVKLNLVELSKIDNDPVVTGGKPAVL
jgi:hypothetical protein